MSFCVAKITAISLFLGCLIVPASSWAVGQLNGRANLSYVQFDATENGNHLYSGNSFVQQYSLAYNASNLRYKNQQNYYNLMVGYDLIDFSTNIDQPHTETSIKQHNGGLKYSGDIAYRFAQYPVRFNAYTNDNETVSMGTNYPETLIPDGLAYRLNNYGQSISSGFYIAFEPKTSNIVSLKALPAVYIKYDETARKNSTGLNRIDEKTRTISVAGLHQDNNWVNYRFLNYEDYLRPESNYVRQQFQIGHVDPVGRRNWSALTNWIEVSADGQLTTRRGKDPLDEYDLNFMAVATRRLWSARTFLNYNRSLDTENASTSLTETARVPIYVNGVYGPQTDWYMRVSTEKGSLKRYESEIINQTSYSNMVSLGGTTFKRHLFTLSPSITVNKSKGFGGTDVIDLLADVETISTARFSRKGGLGAKLSSRYHDGGSGSYDDKSLDNWLDLNAYYRPERDVSYSFREILLFGDAVPTGNVQSQSGSERYLGSFSSAIISWTPNAVFNTTLSSLYEMQRRENGLNSNKLEFIHNLSFDKKTTSFRLSTKYSQSKNNASRRQELTNTNSLLGNDLINTGNNMVYNTVSSSANTLNNSTLLENSGDFQFRPDRYTDALLRYNYSMLDYNSIKSTHLKITEKYSYKFFTRSGLSRNFATFTQEAGYERITNALSLSSRYLQLSGRYSPTERLSLYGSAKYEQLQSDLTSSVLYYNAGMSASFKLLSASLDYSYAKRDSDNRVEKKLSGSVSRTF
jgi:hypothetical protein